MTKLSLNGVRVGTDTDARLEVGRQPFDQDLLHNLRRQHGRDYLFKRGGTEGDEIWCVPLAAGLQPIGETVEWASPDELPGLVSSLALEALFRLFVRLERDVIGWRPLRVLSQQPRNLIPESSGLPSWLQRRVVFAFDTRRIRPAGREPEPVLLCRGERKSRTSSPASMVVQSRCRGDWAGIQVGHCLNTAHTKYPACTYAECIALNRFYPEFTSSHIEVRPRTPKR